MPRSTARGQLTLDFLTGMAVFFVVVGFVFAFVPGLLSATDDGQADPLVADRVANQLVDYHLGEPSTVALDPTCTVEFFSQTGSACGSFDTGDSLDTQLGIDDRHRVNVTLRADVAGGPEREILCEDGSSFGACAPGGTKLAVGPTYLSGEGSVVTAERHVSIDGTDALLVVEVW